MRTPSVLHQTLPSRPRRRALLAGTYALLLLSCDNPLAPNNSDVARIELNPTAVTMNVGDTRPVTARVFDESGTVLTDRPPFWSSLSPGVATVSQAGIITGITQGVTQVAASVGGKSALVAVTVSARPVTSVRVTPPTTTVVAGSTASLAAQGLDVGGTAVTGRPVLWSSSNASIATVSSTGVVTGVDAGTATITATIDGISGSAIVNVQPIPVASVVINPNTGSVIVGRTLQLIAAPLDANGGSLAGRVVTWSSSNASMASVSSTGLVTGVSAGRVTITATSEGKSGTSTITSTLAPVDTVTVTPAAPTIASGQTVQLSTRLADASGNTLSGRTITWNSDQPAIATVNASGLVTGVGTGTARITAASEGKSGTSLVSVTPVPVASISITPNAPTLVMGGTQQLTAVARDAQNNALPGRVVTWISGAPSTVSVSRTGLVTALAVGSAVVFAASEGVSSSVTVTVSSIGISLVRVQPSTGSLTQGQQMQLTATALDAQGAAIPGKVATWSSSSDAIATVSSSGLVTAISPGTVTITATIDGVKGTATLAIAQTPVALVTVSPSSATLNPGQTQPFVVSLADALGRPISTLGRTIGWSSNNTAVATVNPSGVVTAVAAGTATIAATTEGVRGTATVTVNSVTVSAVTPSPNSTTVQQGTTGTVVFTVTGGAPAGPLAGRTVTLVSSDQTIATVSPASATTDALGKVTATITGVATGTVTITGTSGGVSGVAAVTITSIPIASITVAPLTGNLTVGATLQLTATARDAANNILTGRTFTWTSSAPSVATVSSTGLVTALTVGNATITASAAGTAATGTSAVNVTLAPVASLVLVPSGATISVGNQTSFTATLFDASSNLLSAVGRTITWSSLDPGIATVNSQGVVTGVSVANNARIVASTPGAAGNVADTARVNVTNVPVDHVVITQAPAANLYVGAPYARTFVATAFDASNNVLTGRNFLWTSSQQSVAQVTANGGVVTGIATGNSIIIATTGGVADSVNVTVSLVPISSASIALNPPSQADSVAIGGSRVYTATPRDSGGTIISGAALGGRAPTWSTGASSGSASLVANGASVTATGSGAGSVVVQAIYGAPAAPATSTLKVLTPATHIIMSTSPADSVLVGSTTSVTATAADAGNQPIPGRVVTLSTSNSGVASLGTTSGTGSLTSTVTGAGAPAGRNSATLTGSAPFDNVSATSTVIVLAPVNQIVVSAADSIFIGATTAASAVVRDAANNVLTGRPITWSTGNAGIATISPGGVATGVAPGSTTVTASVVTEGKSGSRNLGVIDPVASVGLTVARTAIRVGETLPTTVTLTGSLGGPVTGRPVSYNSTNPAVVSVSATGVITALTNGSADVTASSEGKTSPPLSFTVTLAPIASVTLSAPDSSIFAGQQITAAVVARDTANNIVSLTPRTVVWSSSNLATATVTSGSTGGLITALAVGSTNIGVTVDGIAPSGPIPLTVALVPVASVQVSPSPHSLIVGDNFTFTATLRDSANNVLSPAGRTIAWSSSNALKATINASSGATVAIDSGTTTISATSEGKTGTSVLTVSLVPISTVSFSPTTQTVNVGATANITVRVRDAGSAALAGRACTIASSDTNKLTIAPASSLTDALGEIAVTLTGVASSAGVDPVVTATCEGKVATATVTVP